MVDVNQEASLEEEQQQLQHAMDPTYTPLCSCYCFGSNTSVKRRSPSSSATEHRACKKLFLDQQQDLTLNGVSTISFPNTLARPSSGLSPLPQSVKGVVQHDPTKEEDSNSMRLRKMKGCLREMRKWWDEVMREEEEEEDKLDQGDEGDNKSLSNSKDQDDSEGDAEEAVKIEWADKCLCIRFKCPCSKGYQILLSGNNCYYKLV